jgi:DUF1365 family protein
MKDAQLIVGQVMHERLRPVRNRFVYPVFCVLCNVDRLAELNCWWFGVDRFHAIGLRHSDYGDGQPGPWIRRLLAEAGLPRCGDAEGDRAGDIRLMTFPRVFGYAFNPVSFWYCRNGQGELVALLADVRNTFGERHRYLLTAPDDSPIRPDQVLRCRKVFHVSPFCAVEGHYEFRLRDTEETVFVGIDYVDSAGLLLKTAIGGRRLPFAARHVWAALLGQPLLTVGIVVRIHLQALRLWRRGLRIFRKPPPPGRELSHSHSEGSQA